MEWSEWESWYREIVEEFGYSGEEDEKAAKVLDELIGDRALTFAELRLRVGGDIAIVAGAGESLEDDVDRFLGSNLIGRTAIFAADGASKPFLDRGLAPHVVVTDLDGGDEILLKASEMGSIMVVHAHGDNIDALRRLVPRFHSPIFGTTQSRPFKKIYNVGGFTDGDRAAYLASALNFRTIILIGMNLVPKSENEVEEKKLFFAKKLLERLASTAPGRFYNATGGKRVEIRGFQATSFRELDEIFR